MNKPGKNVKLSHYRPGQVLWGSGGLGSQYFSIIGAWWSSSCQPYAPAAFTSKKYSWYSFLLEAESTPGPYIVRPEGLTQWKIPMIPLEIEPATLRLVGQCLNQLRHRVPLKYWDGTVTKKLQGPLPSVSFPISLITRIYYPELLTQQWNKTLIH